MITIQSVNESCNNVHQKWPICQEFLTHRDFFCMCMYTNVLSRAKMAQLSGMFIYPVAHLSGVHCIYIYIYQSSIHDCIVAIAKQVFTCSVVITLLTATVMSVAAGRPPNLSKEALSHVVRTYFNFSSVHEESVKIFPSYTDRNYYFEGECLDGGGPEFVLKLYNPLCSSLSELKGINEIMNLIQSCGIIPQRPQNSRAGPDVIELYHRELLMDNTSNKRVTSVKEKVALKDGPGLSISAELFCYASVLSFAHGEMFDHVEKEYLIPDLLHEIGVMLAKMDKELMVSRCSALSLAMASCTILCHQWPICTILWL